MKVSESEGVCRTRWLTPGIASKGAGRDQCHLRRCQSIPCCRTTARPPFVKARRRGQSMSHRLEVAIRHEAPWHTVLHLLSSDGILGCPPHGLRAALLRVGAFAGSRSCRAAPLQHCCECRDGGTSRHGDRWLRKRPASFFYSFSQCPTELSHDIARNLPLPSIAGADLFFLVLKRLGMPPLCDPSLQL